jgi:hypothetical protein
MRAWLIVALSVLSAEAQTDQVIGGNSLLDKARSNVKMAPAYYFDSIGTNTPAFEQYAVTFMLNQVNKVCETWKLDIAHPLTINDIIFSAKATPQGIDGGIGTRDKRFSWKFANSWLFSFHDDWYSPKLWAYKQFRYVDNDPARLVDIKSLIDARQAEEIASDALRQLGYNDEGLGLINPPVVKQYDNGDPAVPLPVFNVQWHVRGYDDSGTGMCLRFDVSGISKRVVEYLNFDPHIPHLPLPPNYFEMLNLPTNYLETVSSHQRKLWGMPPLKK